MSCGCCGRGFVHHLQPPLAQPPAKTTICCVESMVMSCSPKSLPSFMHNSFLEGANTKCHFTSPVARHIFFRPWGSVPGCPSCKGNQCKELDRYGAHKPYKPYQGSHPLLCWASWATGCFSASCSDSPGSVNAHQNNGEAYLLT